MTAALKQTFFLFEVFLEQGLEDRDDMPCYGREKVINATGQDYVSN